MALFNIREVYPGVSLGLWQIDEAIDDFYECYPWLKKYQSDLEKRCKNDGRKKEFLAVRALLHEVLLARGGSEQKIDAMGDIAYNEYGKPLLRGYHISISHTQGYAALIISKKRLVGVDIEYINDRVKRVADKFLRRDEVAGDLDSLLVHWCSKETVYKLFSEENLQFHEMRVLPFDVQAEWTCKVENLKSNRVAVVDYELTMDFILTYSAL